MKINFSCLREERLKLMGKVTVTTWALLNSFNRVLNAQMCKIVYKDNCSNAKVCDD